MENIPIWRFYLAALIVGVLSSLLALILYGLVSLIISFYKYLATGVFSVNFNADSETVYSLIQSVHNAWILIPVILAAVIISYALTWRDPSTWGASVDGALRAYHLRAAVIKPRSLLLKLIATSLLVASGASTGLLGPSIFIGGGVIGLLLLIRHIPFIYRRRLFLAGVAGVLSSIFRAPLGAAIYALEAPYHRDLETRAIISVVVSSLTSYTITILLTGYKPLLPIINLPVTIVFHPLTLLLVSLLGITTGFLSRYWADLYRFFNRLSHNRNHYVLGLTVALLIVLIGISLPGSTGTGQLLIASLVTCTTKYSIIILAAILAARFILSVLITGFRGSGGLFAPGIVIGGLMGYLLSIPFQNNYLTSIMVLAGMAGFYGGVSTTPIGTSIILAEMTGSYPLILPVLVSALIAREIVGRKYLYIYQRDRKLYRVVEQLRNTYEYIAEHNPVYRRLRIKRFRDYIEKPVIRKYRDVKADPGGLLAYMTITGGDYIVVTRDRDYYVLTMDSLINSITRRKPPLLVKPPIHGLEDSIESIVEDITRYNTQYVILVEEDRVYVLTVRKLYNAVALDYLKARTP